MAINLLQSMLDDLHKLNRNEMQQLKDRITANLAHGMGVAADSDADATVVLTMIITIMRDRNLESSTLPLLRKSPVYKSFCDKVPGVFEYLKRAGETKAQRHSLLNLGVKLLIGDMQDKGLDLSARLVMAHIHRIPQVLNASFPGYAEAGMLKMIVERH